jgi:SAM-dependent MidA family methyltransferase
VTSSRATPSRATPLEEELRRLIALEGPISVERYMDLCLAHPAHGYYRTRDPLGAAGDFTTAPEISQMFGELIGVWAANVWSTIGSPAAFRLVELGPGRGTLMADALRALKVLPAFLEACSVHLVETSPALRERQRAALEGAGVPLHWHERVDEVPDGPVIAVANEFFDALPIRQYVGTARGWCERRVGLVEDRLAFGLSAEPEPAIRAPVREGAVLEVSPAAVAVARALSRRIAAQGGALLAIDYGYLERGDETGGLDTLQAVRAHAYADPLADPGEADLTAHVDFQALAAAGLAEGAAVHGPATQGEFLRALGIEVRAASLKKRASGTQAEAIDAAVCRLSGGAKGEMGVLFKVLGLAHPALPGLPGLARRPSPPTAEDAP